MNTNLEKLFNCPTETAGSLIRCLRPTEELEPNQKQTQRIFSDKWDKAEKLEEVELLYKSQREWFLDLYGFNSETQLAEFLQKQPVIIDAGCGLGYKAAWFARLAPASIVIGLDISDAAILAARNFSGQSNLYFHQCDIANTPLRSGSVDFLVCDQVIHHTQVPEQTFAHLSTLLSPQGQFACYVYKKKALPRELLDEYFRTRTHEINDESMWEMSAQLTELGKRLSDLKVSFDCPDVPLLGIKGGTIDIQRFVYWNFLKCFWREEWGFELSKSTNYDWYAPSNAYRYSKEEYQALVSANHLRVVSFHEEEACLSGRFARK